MLGGPIGAGKNNSLLSEYSLKLGEAVLRSRTQEAEKSARMEVEIANRIKSEFISNMSHELRTPLNTVIGFSKLLAEHGRRRLSDGEVVEYAHLIHDASCNLLSIINDILDISKIQSGHFRIDSHEVSLDDILEGVVASLRADANRANVAIDLNTGSEPLTVRGDANKLRQSFANLIGNAVKFTSLGGKVEINCQAERNGTVCVHIRDTGLGMDQQEIDLALSPFGQVDGTRARWREGTGLGLPIAKALIELQGGSLSITSEKNIGTNVSVVLPPPEFVAYLQRGLDFQIRNA